MRRGRRVKPGRALVDLRFRAWRLRAGLWPTLATAALLPALVGLGFWQLDRAAQKQALQAEYDRRQTDTPVGIDARLQPAEELRYYRVEARGRYLPQYHILLDNRIHRGQVGYEVLTPLRLEGGDTAVLVNRGWVALGVDREHLPAIATPDGVVQVTGVAVVPHADGFHLGGPTPPGSGWQPVWEYLDLGAYAQRVPLALQPVVVLLDPDSAAGGFAREWARLDAGIATHQGYAFQWFTLAAALVTIYIVVNTRRIDDAATGRDVE